MDLQEDMMPKVYYARNVFLEMLDGCGVALQNHMEELKEEHKDDPAALKAIEEGIKTLGQARDSVQKMKKATDKREETTKGREEIC